MSANPVQVPDEIRTRYRLAGPTLASICRIAPRPDRRLVFRTACSAIELQTIPVRAAERAWLRHVNDHTPIPYPIPAAALLAEPWHKVSLLVQADLCGHHQPSVAAAAAKLSQRARRDLHADRAAVYAILDQVLRCVVDVLGLRRDGRGVRVALDVLRSVHARVWEGGPADGAELLQVRGIGAARLRRLVDAGVRSVRRLAGLEFYHIERLMSRNPPYGQTLLRQLAGFPLLTMRLESLGPRRGVRSETRHGEEARGGDALWMVRATLGFENAQVPLWEGKTPWVSLVMERMSNDDDDDGGADGKEEQGSLMWFWRGSVKALQDGGGGKEMVVGVAGSKGCQLKATLACEVLVGTMVQQQLTL